jgi:chromosome transmission fidelity protein 18
MVRAMHGNTLYGEQRPNCIILDEIDGIDGRASIETLVNIVKAPLKSGSAGKGKKSASHALALTRPLICVCNDQFAPALRELRKVMN